MANLIVIAVITVLALTIIMYGIESTQEEITYDSQTRDNYSSAIAPFLVFILVTAIVLISYQEHKRKK